MPIKRTQATQATQAAQATTGGSLKRRSRTTPVEAQPAPTPASAPAPAAAEPAAMEQRAAAPIVRSLALPALDAPAVSANEPARSYKIDFADKGNWFVSTDGGASKSNTKSRVIAGAPIDLALQISKAKGREGFDQRLRLAFYEPSEDAGDELVLSEINCNAVNTDRDGNLYVTSSARSLTGALLAISDSEDDIEAFCAGARFRLRPGTGKGVFIEVDIATQDAWVAMSSPANTNRVAKDARGFHSQLALIKSRFRACGQLLSAAAVIGELEAYDSEQRSSDFMEIAVTPME